MNLLGFIIFNMIRKYSLFFFVLLGCVYDIGYVFILFREIIGVIGCV